VTGVRCVKPVAEASENCRNESLGSRSFHFLAKWSGHRRYCLSPQGEFIGGSAMSLEVQNGCGSSIAGGFRSPLIGADNPN